MNLKFQGVDWDQRLMYVSFNLNGENLRWYPKWGEVVEIFDSSLATEHGVNKGRLNEYLLFSCLKLLTRYLLITAERKGALSPEAIREFNLLASRLEKQLYERQPGLRIQRER